MRISEVFSPYLNYAMFGWISPAGSIKLATPANARQSEKYDHTDMVSDLKLGSENSDAFGKGWVRWYIEGDRLCFECYWMPGIHNTKKIISQGTGNIMKLCEDPKNFRHFAVTAPSGRKPNQAHNERILINSYDREAISRDDEEEDDNW
jgi:hypothetical protein